MQHLKRRHKRLLDDLQILSTSPSHKTKRVQEKKLEGSREGLSAGALLAHRTVQCDKFTQNDMASTVFPSLESSVGTKFYPFQFPWRLNYPHSHRLIEEFPMRNWGSGSHCHLYLLPTSHLLHVGQIQTKLFSLSYRYPLTFQIT
jgi:hypothetical protein